MMKKMIMALCIFICAFTLVACSGQQTNESLTLDRCDDATRNYLRENIDKAKLGDPSGFTESIRANYAN